MKAAHYTATVNCDRTTGFLKQDVKIMTNVISGNDAYIHWSSECHPNGNAEIGGKHASRDKQSNAPADKILVPETFAVAAPVKQAFPVVQHNELKCGICAQDLAARPAIANGFIERHIESISLSLNRVPVGLKQFSNMPHVRQDRREPASMREKEELT